MLLIIKEFFYVLLFSLLTVGVTGFLLYLLPGAVAARRYDFIQLKPLAILILYLLICLGESLCLFGAWRARRQIDRAAAVIEQTVSSATEITQSEFTALMQEYLPQADRYIESGNRQIGNAGNDAKNYVASIRRQVSRYMWRRIGWMTGFFLLGAALLWHDAETQRRRQAISMSFLQSSDY